MKERSTPEELAKDRRELLRTIGEARIVASNGQTAHYVADVITELCELNDLMIGSPKFDAAGDIRLVGVDDPYDTPVNWVNAITGEVI